MAGQRGASWADLRQCLPTALISVGGFSASCGLDADWTGGDVPLVLATSPAPGPRDCRARGPAATEEWHRYALTAFVDRKSGRTRQHCRQGHEPWPGLRRHTRLQGEAAGQDRAAAYGADVDRLAARPVLVHAPGVLASALCGSSAGRPPGLSGWTHRRAAHRRPSQRPSDLAPEPCPRRGMAYCRGVSDESR